MRLVGRREFLLGSALATAGLLVGCSSSGESDDGVTAVKIAYLPITHALALFEEVELLEADDDAAISIELVQYSAWSELMDALNSGQVDGAVVLVELAMRAVEQGIDLRAVALGHRDGNVIVAAEDIETAADLAGCTIAIPSRQSSHYILVLQALAEAGLSEDDVTLTELSPAEMPSALASDQIQAYCVAEPFGAKGVDMGIGHVLYNSEELWEDSLCCALVLYGGFIDDEPDAAAALVQGYLDAGDALAASYDETLRVAEEYLDQTEEVLTTSLQWISYNDLRIDEETYDQLVEYVLEYGLSDDPPSYEEFVVDLVAEE